jgi:hypothetical protein
MTLANLMIYVRGKGEERNQFGLEPFFPYVLDTIYATRQSQTYLSKILGTTGVEDSKTYVCA